MQSVKKLKHRLNVWGVKKNIFLRGVKHEEKKKGHEEIIRSSFGLAELRSGFHK